MKIANMAEPQSYDEAFAETWLTAEHYSGKLEVTVKLEWKVNRR